MTAVFVKNKGKINSKTIFTVFGDLKSNIFYSRPTTVDKRYFFVYILKKLPFLIHKSFLQFLYFPF